MPEDEPEGDAERGTCPEALPDRAAYFAHRMAAAPELGRGKRRGGGDDTNAENHQGEIEIGAKRARSQRLRSEPAQHDDVGCIDRNLRKIGGNERQGERKRCSGFIEPEASCRSVCRIERAHCRTFL